MPKYADLDNLLADYLPEATSANDRAAVGRILDNVSAFVDSYCRRAPGYFAGVEITPVAPSTEPTFPPATVKQIRGEGRNFLRLPVHVFGTAEIQDFAPAGNYYESDVNGWLYLDAPVQNLFDSGDFYQPRFSDGRIYLVSAVWGYRNTPLDLSEAVRLIVKNIWETQDGVLGQISPAGFVTKPDLIPPDALLILDRYKRREFEI